MFYFLFAALGYLVLTRKPAAPRSVAESMGLPWFPPIMVAPSIIKTRDSSHGTFPVDVYRWSLPDAGNTYFLVMASDDRTSYVGYAVAGSEQQKILTAKGPGPLSSQIQAQI